MKSTLYVLLLVIGVTASARAEMRRCDASELPARAQKLIEQRFPAWTLLTFSDLSSDDQLLWKENYEGRCPGIVEGNFSAVPRSFAISLIRRHGGSLTQVLILLQRSGAEYMVRELSKESTATVPNVILKFPPGTYRDAAQRQTIHTKFDGIAYIKLEAAGTLYYKAAHGFRSLEISE